MKLPFNIPSDSLIETYGKVRERLDGHDILIFDAMAAITSGRYAFIPPIGPHEYAQKHDEIRAKLRYPHALQAIQTAMLLMEHILKQVEPLGGIGRYSTNDLLDTMVFRTSRHPVIFFLNIDMHWAAGWTVGLRTPGVYDQRKVALEVHDNTWGEIVPLYLVPYIHTALSAYQEGLYGVAVALLSIAVEATLRDVLITKGYTFDRFASSEDIFAYAKAEVHEVGGNYSLLFQQPMPMVPTDFSSVFGGKPVEIEIRRTINSRKKRVDLEIKASDSFIDFWSSQTITQPAQKKVNGLGEALDIARNKERFLTATILPPDFDAVLQAARNNLVHLSGNALNTPLPMFDNPASPHRFTLKDFLEEDDMVFDFIVNVPDFISKQYRDLRSAGHIGSP